METGGEVYRCTGRDARARIPGGDPILRTDIVVDGDHLFRGDAGIDSNIPQLGPTCFTVVAVNVDGPRTPRSTTGPRSPVDRGRQERQDVRGRVDEGVPALGNDGGRQPREQRLEASDDPVGVAQRVARAHQ